MTIPQPMSETNVNYQNKDWLERRYVADRCSTIMIAEECGVSHKTISRYLHKHGIPVRHAGDAQIGNRQRGMLADININSQ